MASNIFILSNSILLLPIASVKLVLCKGFLPVHLRILALPVRPSSSHWSTVGQNWSSRRVKHRSHAPQPPHTRVNDTDHINGTKFISIHFSFFNNFLFFSNLKLYELTKLII